MPKSEAQKTLLPDSRGRISLGNLAKGVVSFKVHQDKSGRIILEPQLAVPAAEEWLLRNARAMRAVQRGLKDSAEGRLIERGSFARHLDESDR